MSGNKELGQEKINFYDIIYSMAGQRDVPAVYEILSEVDRDLLDDEESEILGFMLDAYKSEGVFPSNALLGEKYAVESKKICRNKADISVSLKQLLNDRRLMFGNQQISMIISQAKDTQELTEEIGKFLENNKVAADVKLEIYTSMKDQYEQSKDLKGGIMTGIETIDEKTGGFQPGTVATIAAFTSHGKSTVSNNLAYINAMNGKKVAIFSLEIIKEVVYKQLMSRHSLEDGKKPIPYSIIVKAQMSKDEEKHYFENLEPTFRDQVAGNLLVLGTEDITKYEENAVAALYRKIEEVLGGLDAVVWDHVNQFKYVQPEAKLTGDHYIHMLTKIGNSYTNQQGRKIVTIMPAQTNRQGYMRALRRDGEYDMTALSDFNEIERSSTYVIFCYADETDREQGAMKVQLAKHRLGPLMIGTETIEADFAYAKVGNDFSDTLDGIGDEREDEMFSGFNSDDESMFGEDMNSFGGSGMM